MRRLAVLALLVLLQACGGGGREEVVRSFHGYPWGTPVAEIPEIAGKEPVGSKDDLEIYSAEVTYLGRSALAGFYFHPRTGGLVEGYYVIPLSLEECEAEWERYLADLGRAYPSLRREGEVPERAAADSARYSSDCEYFVYNGERLSWTAAFVNPEPPRDRAGAWLSIEGRSIRLTLYFRGREGQAWEGRFRWPRLPGRPSAPREEPGPAPPGTEGLPIGRA